MLLLFVEVRKDEWPGCKSECKVEFLCWSEQERAAGTDLSALRDVKHSCVSQQSSLVSGGLIPAEGQLILCSGSSQQPCKGQVSSVYSGVPSCTFSRWLSQLCSVLRSSLWDAGRDQQVLGSRTALNPGVPIGTKGPGYC